MELPPSELGVEAPVGRGGVAEWIDVPAWRTCRLVVREVPTRWRAAFGISLSRGHGVSVAPAALRAING